MSFNELGSRNKIKIERNLLMYEKILTVARMFPMIFHDQPLSYPFGKEPNQKKYLSATVQSLERNATQSFDIV